MVHAALGLVWLHCVVLMVGGHYPYALVPGFAPTDALGRARGWTHDNYDKPGHFAPGFVPAILVREILPQNSPLSLPVKHWDETERISCGCPC